MKTYKHIWSIIKAIIRVFVLVCMHACMHAYIYIYIYVYIYIYMCVCVRVVRVYRHESEERTHPNGLGPPVKRLEQGYPFLSVVYVSRGTLPTIKGVRKGCWGNLEMVHSDGPNPRILQPPHRLHHRCRNHPVMLQSVVVIQYHQRPRID